MSLGIMGLFLAGLVACIVQSVSVLWALSFGLLLFSAYALYKGFSLKNIAEFWRKGFSTVGNVVLILMLIGMLTGTWRAAGTIAYIIEIALPFVNPAVFTLCVFLLCAVVSMLLGSSFGTASTIGVILLLLARSAGIDEVIVGGAMLSGSYVGDRCSPLSSSAALVCAVTGTNIYDNIKGMMKTGAVPFALCCVLYAAISYFLPVHSATLASTHFEQAFTLSPWALLPVFVVFFLPFFRVGVKKVMGLGIVSAAVVCFFVQGQSAADIAKTLVLGFSAPAGFELFSGGGMQSMVTVSCIILLSSPYAPLFHATELVSSLEHGIKKLGRRIGSFRTLSLVSILMGMISCSQMLTVLLAAQVSEKLYKKREDMAIPLENSAILLPVLIPWNISGGVPCSIVEVSTAAMFFAFYPMLVPLWHALKR